MSVLNAQARIMQNFQYVRLNNLSQTWPARSHKVSPTKSLGFHHLGEEQLRWEHWIQEECAMCTLNQPQPEVMETIEHHWNEEAMFPCSTPPPPEHDKWACRQAHLCVSLTCESHLTNPQQKRKVSSFLPRHQVILGGNLGRSQLKSCEITSKSQETSGPATEV